jgi:hypothetical protein
VRTTAEYADSVTKADSKKRCAAAWRAISHNLTVLIDYHFQHACDVIKAELGIVRIGGVDTSDKPEWNASQHRSECWRMRNAM